MHPGNRLPSVSMSIVLIGFLFLTGYLHTTDATKQFATNSKPSQHQRQMATRTVDDPSKSLFLSISQPSYNFTSAGVVTADSKSSHNRSISQNKQFSQAAPTTINLFANKKAAPGTHVIADPSPGEEYFNTAEEQDLIGVNNTFAATIITNNHFVKQRDGGDNDLGFKLNNNSPFNLPAVVNEKTDTYGTAVKSDEITTAVAPPANEVKDAQAATSPGNLKAPGNTNTSSKNNLSATDKAWIEDFAMHNKPVAKKWAGKLSLQAYITPSLVYRRLNNNAADKQLPGTSDDYNNFNADAVVKHKPSFGLEGGLALLYDVSRRIRLKAGAQFNYTRYNAFAFETSHPIATTLTMNYENNRLTYEAYRTSNYSNLPGYYNKKLHNETYQLSIPVGVDFKLASLSDNLFWYAGATAQPTIVLFAKSFVISSDRRSYVHDPSLLNRFNLNAGFESYLSYKTCGYSLQFGPQYRTQLFTTNTKLYSVEERLQNFGFKVGIAKRL